MIRNRDFEKYEKVKNSNANMWDIRKVSKLSGLDRMTILEIMRGDSNVIR